MKDRVLIQGRAETRSGCGSEGCGHSPVSVEEDTVELCEAHSDWRGVVLGGVGDEGLLQEETLTCGGREEGRDGEKRKRKKKGG